MMQELQKEMKKNKFRKDSYRKTLNKLMQSKNKNYKFL